MPLNSQPGGHASDSPEDLGIEPSYLDAGGSRRSPPKEVVSRLREILGPPSGGTVRFSGPDDRLEVGPASLVLEDGTHVDVERCLPPGLPFGYHTIAGSGPQPTRLVVSPRRCHRVQGERAWGWAAQLYSLRSRRSWGMGDLADLATLATRSADELGTGFVLVNPIYAVAPGAAQQPSPYFPATRRFLNPIYIALEEVPGWEPASDHLTYPPETARALNEMRPIDRDAVWRLKSRALFAIWERTGGGGEFHSWFDRQPGSLTQFGAWCSLAEELGPDWRRWPTQYRHPEAAAVSRFAGHARQRVTFHAWMQWLAGRQLEAASRPIPLFLDLPIGVDPGGFDAWCWQDLFADGVTIGAPPDEFSEQGQNWGLSAFVPTRLRARDYEPFVETLRFAFAHAKGLRVDHVMGLYRLWWVLEGDHASRGAYVRYPSGELLDILALESVRAGAVVIGEDLGTVEESVREDLAARDVLSCRVLWFEPEEPRRWPPNAMAAVTTHDLPTIAGVWTGEDLEDQRRAGLEPLVSAARSMKERLLAGAAEGGDAGTEGAVEDAYRLLASSPCELLSATLEDVALEPLRPNLPGTGESRRNWSRGLPLCLEELLEAPSTRRVARVLTEAVAGPGADLPTFRDDSPNTSGVG